MNKIPALLLWLALIAVGCGLGPPNRPDLGAWVVDLLLGRWEGQPPWVVAEFQWMGLWPALVGLMLRPDWRGRPPAWPFLLASLALGCYALLPWFVLRSGPRAQREGGGLSRWEIPAVLGLIATALLAWAAASGDPAEIGRAMLSDGFVWSMSLDFLAFWVTSVAEARARARAAAWQWTLLPLVGLAVWLALEGREGAVRS